MGLDAFTIDSFFFFYLFSFTCNYCKNTKWYKVIMTIMRQCGETLSRIYCVVLYALEWITSCNSSPHPRPFHFYFFFLLYYIHHTYTYTCSICTHTHLFTRHGTSSHISYPFLARELKMPCVFRIQKIPFELNY